MSDDGYYPGSPYDEFDDSYYDDDVGENLADNLAEHTLPSPIYHEDPAYEMLEYYSDWEYYSDDYYDDDPALLNKNPQTGSPTKKRSIPDKSQSRGKKRKLADTKDIPELALDDRPSLAATVRGTVWAKPKPQSPKPYEGGQGQRIALLKDWAQIFERTSPRSILKRDESWANDLSLEDMGLHKVESKPAQDDGAPDPGEDEMVEEDELIDGDEEGDMDTNAKGQLDGSIDGGADHGEDMMDEDEINSKPDKRQRIVAPIPSPPPSYNSSNTSTDTIVADMKNTSMKAVDDNGLSKTSRGRTKPKSYLNLTESKKSEVETSVKTRKRKASPDVEVTETASTKTTASSRAKRVASSKLATAKEEKPPPLPKTTRATRSWKK